MEQGNVAKKLTGQILENWLLTLADGHGGIQTITKTGTSGLVDTYTIAFADETTSTFTVTNGRSISGLTTSKSGKVTTITITYNDNTTSSFTVRDGENVSSITEYWAVSTSGSQQPQSGWQTTPPTLTATYKYLWHYSKYTFSDGTNTSTTPAVQGVYGDKGDTGNTGTSITSVTKTGTSGLVDIYTITFSNGTTTTFNVTNGSEIESIEKTSTAGLVDTYTVTMGSGDTHTFTVTNGRSIVSFTQTSGTHAAGTIDVYTMTYNDGDTSQIQVYNGANGTGAVSTVAGIGVSSADGDVPLIIRGYGAPTTATVGQVNQLYFDMTGGIMYICIASAGGSYDWRGMSSAVDSAMSTTSANPLQNRVISNKVGVGSLSSEFSATNLTDAANELMTAMGGKAPTSHASSTTTYGKGTSTNYGHVKISDSLTDTTPAATGGIVPSMKAVSDLNGAINNLSRIYGKQIAIYGDSWATETYGALGATYLSQMSGKTVHISASGSKTMKNVLDDFWDNYNADIYIIQAGLNDKVQNVGATQFIKAIKDFVAAIRTVNTNAEIYFITPQMTHVANQYQNCFPNEFYRTIIWRLSGIYGFNVINSLKWTDVKLLSDNTHPTSASYPLIANHIANAIQNYGDEETHDTEFSNLGRENNQLLFYCEGGIFFFLTQNVSIEAMSANYAQIGFNIGTVFMYAETVTTNRANGAFTRMYYNASQPNYIQFSVASLASGDTFTNNGTKLIVSIVDLQIPVNAW